MFSRFIDWKKNITPFSCYAISFTFDKVKNNFAVLKEELLNLIPYLENEKLNEKLSKEGFKSEKSDYGQLLSVELDIAIAPSVEVKEKITIFESKVDFKQLDRLGLNAISRVYPSILLDKLLSYQSVKLGVLYNPHYRNWENNIFPGSYYYRKGLKTYYDPKLTVKAVDISDRPGRTTELGKLRFIGASDYWFGPAIFNTFPRELLLAFPQAQQIRELPNGIIHLHLFELDDYWTDEAQATIQALRDHLRIDQLAQAYQAAKQARWEQRKGK